MGWLRALGLLVGIVLLLPGACSLGFIVFFIGAAWQGPSGGGASEFGSLAMLWMFCFFVSAGGVVLIRYAVRGPQPARRDPPT